MELDGPVRRTVLVDGLSQQSVSRDLGNLCTGKRFSSRVRGFGELSVLGMIEWLCARVDVSTHDFRRSSARVRPDVYGGDTGLSARSRRTVGGGFSLDPR